MEQRVLKLFPVPISHNLKLIAILHFLRPRQQTSNDGLSQRVMPVLSTDQFLPYDMIITHYMYCVGTKWFLCMI